MYIDLKGLLILCSWVPTLVGAQTLPEVLSVYSQQLSSLSALIKSSSAFNEQLKTADNFTFLAPSNDAISKWLAKNRSADYIQATLQYHLLNGTYPKASISSTPQFVASYLTNTSYCNVTGGQRVKVSNNGNLAFESAIQTRSNALTADIVALGGFVHIIDTVLELPIGPIETFQAENLSYFLAIASQNGLLSSRYRPYIDAALTRTDLMFFLPNSAEALASVNTTGLNATRWMDLAAYGMFPQTIYSTGFVNGTQLTGFIGYPVYVTVHEGEIYINTAKITSRDHFISNGVFHVVDNFLGDPQNPDLPPSRPSFPSNSNENTTSAPSNGSESLSRGIKTGIGAGIVGGVVLIILVVATFVCYRKRRSKAAGGSRHGITKLGELGDTSHQMIMQLEAIESKAEMSTNSQHELPQLETKETPVELPAGYIFHHEIGRAF